MMKKLKESKYGWVIVAAVFLLAVYASTFIRYRIDLTAEKRFSLSAPTEQILQQLDTPVTIRVFLTGDLSADYKKLSIATDDLLAEFRDASHNLVRVSFEKPGEGLPDSLRFALYDSLQRMGVVFVNDEDISQDNNSSTQKIIIPSALVEYKNMKPVAVDLRSSRTVFKQYNVVTDNPEEDKEATLNSAEALLEYKFINAIDKLTRKYVPAVAYCVGNGEPIDLTINDLGENLRNEYRLGIFNLKQAYPDPKVMDAMLIVKPTQPFTDEDKLKIDQYIMHGGKVIWCVDKLYAELDSLMRSQADFIAFDRNLNIDDILFKYGIRINGDLLQDLNCSKIPIVIGRNPDGSPRMQRIPWAYYPFLSSNNDNPISKNLDRVLPIFPSSIDTVKSPDVYKTILLASDTNSRVISSPAMVSLNSIKDDNDFATFNKSHVPVAVLMEGKFHSLFANRLTQNVLDSVQHNAGYSFLPQATTSTKQIVMADADIVTNAVSNTTGPLPMGELPFENYRFANREFFLNCVDYMVSNNGLFVSRNKDFTLRVLDKQKVQEDKGFWQFINIGLPVLVVVLFGFVFMWVRGRKYGERQT